LAHAILGLLPRNAASHGTIRYDGELLTPERQSQLRGEHIALIPQSVNSLDPLMRVKNQLRSPRQKSRSSDDLQSAFTMEQMLTRLQLLPEHRKLFPSQLSGGMARRVLMAAAFASRA